MKNKNDNFFDELLDDNNVDNVDKSAGALDSPGDSATGCPAGYTRRTIIMKARLYQLIKIFAHDSKNTIYQQCEKIFKEYFNKPARKKQLQAAAKFLKKNPSY